MKRAKVIISLILVLCLTFCVAGCSSNHDEGSLKDNLIDGWDNWLQSFSKHALTKEKTCKAKRIRVMTHTPVLIQRPMMNSMGKSLSSAEQLWNEPTVINLL